MNPAGYVMRILMKPLYAILLSVLVTGCHQFVDSGSLQDFRVGMSKSDVLELLIRSGDVTDVIPETDKDISLKGRDLLDGEKIKEASSHGALGILNRKKNLRVEVYFAGDRVSGVIGSRLHKDNRLGIRSGLSKDEVVDIILKLAANEEITNIVNMAEGGGWRSTKNLTQEEFDQYDHWGFHRLSERSYIKLHFSEGVLSSIERTWSPIELP